MRVTKLIKVLIVLFTILAGVNILFSTLARRTASEMAEAYTQRNDIRDAIFGMRIGFVNLTRLARSYVLKVEPSYTLLNYAAELRSFEEARENFLRTTPCQNEVHLLERAMEFQNIIRDRDREAFRVLAEGDAQLALDIIHAPDVVQYWVAFLDLFNELDDAVTLRTQIRVDYATQSASRFGALANTAIILFAIFSITGTMIALREAGTVMKKAQEAIENQREAHELTQTLLNSAPLVIDLWDDSRKLVSTSSQAVEMFNLSSKEQYVEMWSALSPERQPCGTPSQYKVLEYLEEGFREGHASFEWMRQTIDGETVPTKVTLMRFKRKGRDMLVSYTSDKREEKRREIAEEESRAKTRFLARMSHEIRTPMNVVLGVTEIQLQNSVLSPETEEAFLRIHTASSLLLAIINDILDLSKIEADKMEIVPSVYEMASLIVDTTQLNLMHIGSKRIEFKLEIAEGMPSYMVGDELRIKQVLNNLLSNAFKYTTSGQVALSFGMERQEESEELILIIRIQDTGQGMTQDQINRLFGIDFTRFNMQSNRAIEGSGLGMMISYQFITMMQGSITVESEVGKGTIFTVRIPQKAHGSEVCSKEMIDNLQNLEVTQRSLSRISNFPREPMPYGRVLVVDDVESNLYVVKSFLMPYKISIQTVTNGYDAIEKVKAREVYDIIFMDHMMPGMDGIEAVKIMRALGYDQPIVALTANIFKGAKEMFLNNGFSGFISKPIDLNELNTYLIRFIRDKQPPEAIDDARRQNDSVKGRSDAENLAALVFADASRALDILEPLAQLQEFSEGELKSFTIQAHAMKNALANIGHSELSMYAAALEIACKKADIETIKAFAPRFMDILREIKAELSPREKSRDEIEKDLLFLRSSLDTIAQAYKQYDAVHNTPDTPEERHQPKKYEELLKEISENLSQINSRLAVKHEQPSGSQGERRT